ncbi:MAG: 2-amino-4-hydroxy-6-hydroxymethyldihydropteridine diphosphokinase [Isosphaeraceae bacterium]|nr:2-amino-4-hydroxy-6-hydroxymethyldihydropteridine diphosphokinase [Isosphaeraceae bacterium]
MGAAAFIGLGSNMGDRKAHLDSALDALDATPGIALFAASSYHETRPVGGAPGQGLFLNAAAAIETSLAPVELLAALQAIERAEGRTRSDRWGERTLDLDLLLFSDHRIRIVASGPPAATEVVHLEVPHPWLPFRRFVLAPLAEIAPDAIDPITGRSVASLFANLDRRPSYVAICDPFNRIECDVEAMLVTALNAARCSGRTERFAAKFPGAGRYSEAASAFLNSLEDIRTELDPATWTRDLADDRWLVTSFWFDEFVYFAEKALTDADRDHFHEAAEAVRCTIVTPTFVVAEPSAVSFYTGEVPILPVATEASRDVVSKVLAACAATRAG